MADSLATLTTKLQALLMDGGTLFTSTTCTAAIRQALHQLNLALPIFGGTLLDTVEGQYEYELTTALAGAVPLTITDVLLDDPSGGEEHTPLTFRSFIEDERWFIRLAQPQAADGQLIVRFTQAHTVADLDSATEGTLSAQHELALLDGAAAQCCLIASAGKVESNNLDPATAINYAKAAVSFEKAFSMAIKTMASRRRAQATPPDDRAWNDRWHGESWGST